MHHGDVRGRSAEGGQAKFEEQDGDFAERLSHGYMVFG
jgi:hypothetical protein